MPRVITGRWRGMRLETPEGDHTRPTSDRMKEALFSIIGDRVWDARVLDLFAGSGQIGIEALSRGARCVVFCDSSRIAGKVLKRNLSRLGAGIEADIYGLPAQKLLKRLALDGSVFDLIYLDPPWAHWDALKRDLLPTLASVLARDGLMILESDRETTWETNAIPGLVCVRSCTYGAGMLSFYHHEEANHDI